MRAVVKSFVAQIVLRILHIADFYIYQKRVTLSESVLLALVVVRAVRATIYGVPGTVMESLFTDTTWMLIFGLLAVFHCLSFAARSLWPRVIVAFANVALWGFLAALGIMAYPLLPGAGDTIVFAILAALLTAKLYNEIGEPVTNV